MFISINSIKKNDISFNITSITSANPKDSYRENDIKEFLDYWRDFNIDLRITYGNLDNNELMKKADPCSYCHSFNKRIFSEAMEKSGCNVFASGFELDDLIYWLMTCYILSNMTYKLENIIDNNDKKQLERRLIRFKPKIINSKGYTIILPMLCLNHIEVMYIINKEKIPTNTVCGVSHFKIQA